MSKEIEKSRQIADDIKTLIETSKEQVAQTVNSEITLLYWNIGKRINEEILGNDRAEYGKQIVASLAQQLREGVWRVIFGKKF